MKTKKHVWMLVDPNFKKKIKSESSLNDMSMIKYTKILASEDLNIRDTFNEFKKKRNYDDPFKI
jgi:hypothetical protein